MKPHRITLLALLAVLLLSISSSAKTIAPRKHHAAPGNEAELGFAVSCKRDGSGFVQVEIELPATPEGTPFSGAGLALESPAGETLLMNTLHVRNSIVHVLVTEAQLPQLVITAHYWNSQITKDDLAFENLSRWLDGTPR